MNEDFINSYKNAFRQAKEGLRNIVLSIMMSKMVFDVLNEIVPSNWAIKPDYWRGDLRVTSACEEIKPTPNELDKLVAKIAKYFNTEPSISIDENSVSASINIYRSKKLGSYSTEYGAAVTIAISTSNTEKCEITYKRKMRKIPILSGYCKELAEKKYLPQVN